MVLVYGSCKGSNCFGNKLLRVLLESAERIKNREIDGLLRERERENSVPLPCRDKSAMPEPFFEFIGYSVR